ncbi:MAG: hypothetical protein GX934_12460 [Burkholderiales bacterium]|nr:hypothetical protein [Burkholderiales bacterium]
MSIPITRPGGLEGQCLRAALSHLVDLRNVMGVLQRRWPDTYHDGGEIRRMEEAIAKRLREVVRESEEARP